MTGNVPKSEQGANVLTALFFLGLGIFFILVNFFFLPFFGMILGIVCLIIAGVFFVKHNKRLSGQKNTQ